MNTLKLTISILLVLLIQSCTSKDSKAMANTETTSSDTVKYWLNDTQLVISISMQFETGGTTAVVNTGDQFITYEKQHKGMVFMQKDAIA